MSKMSPNRTTKPSWKNRRRQPTLSLHVLPDQVHARTKAMGLPRRSAPKSAPVVCGRDEPAPDRPSSRAFTIARSPCGCKPKRPNCPTRRCPARSKKRRWTSCSPSSGTKKTNLHRHDRRSLTRCYLGYQVVWQRTQEAIQEIVDEAPRPNAITAMPLMLMIACGITGVCMKSPRAKPTPTRSKRITPSCAIIWLAWRAARVVFRVVRKH